MIKVILEIDGMKCGMCEAHINDIVRKNSRSKIRKLKSSHKKGITSFLIEDITSLDVIINCINSLGYKIINKNIEE